MGGKNAITAYPLRLPDDLRATLEAVAKDKGRSLNQQIAKMLEAALAAGLTGDDGEMSGMAEQIADLQRRVAQLERAAGHGKNSTG